MAKMCVSIVYNCIRL